MRAKKWAAMVLCVLLVFQLRAAPARAAGHVYFTGAEENILPLSDATMPFWQDNYLYVPSTMFSGAARDSLRVGYSQGGDGSWVALYWGSRALLFKKGVSYGEDQTGRQYYPGAVERGGILFVPAGVVAGFFDLKYSVSTVRGGSLVWLRSKDFILTEDIFLDAASGVMDQRYQEYVGSSVPVLPEPEPEPEPEAPPAVEEPVSGKRLYLCARATEQTADLLDLLDRYGSKMTFFCTADFMAQHHDLLRRMDAGGHGVGILAEEGEGLPGVAEQIEAANRELEQAAFVRTRLVRVEKAAPETLADLLTQGYCVEASGLKRASIPLTGSNRAAELFRAMTASRKTAVVWLDGQVSSGGLMVFLAQADLAEDPCVPLRETTQMP